MGTQVVHVNDGYDIYIGRAVPRRGLPASPWGNPFLMEREADRARVIVLYENWVRWSSDARAAWIREHIEELRGKRIACWCYPKACHGDVLMRILAE